MVLHTSWVAFALMLECQRRWERGVEAGVTHSVTVPRLQGIVTSDCKEEARKTPSGIIGTAFEARMGGGGLG